MHEMMCRLDLKPENVLSMEQIRSLQRLPVEEVAGYISREIAVSRGIKDETLPSIKVCLLSSLKISTLTNMFKVKDRYQSVFLGDN